ncbi:hypothetical protein DFAR_1870012 [Desulfarculales bacterium]
MITPLQQVQVNDMSDPNKLAEKARAAG